MCLSSVIIHSVPSSSLINNIIQDLDCSQTDHLLMHFGANRLAYNANDSRIDFLSLLNRRDPLKLPGLLIRILRWDRNVPQYRTNKDNGVIVQNLMEDLRCGSLPRVTDSHLHPVGIILGSNYCHEFDLGGQGIGIVLEFAKCRTELSHWGWSSSWAVIISIKVILIVIVSAPAPVWQFKLHRIPRQEVCWFLDPGFRYAKLEQPGQFLEVGRIEIMASDIDKSTLESLDACIAFVED